MAKRFIQSIVRAIIKTDVVSTKRLRHMEDAEGHKSRDHKAESKSANDTKITVIDGFTGNIVEEGIENSNDSTDKAEDASIISLRVNLNLPPTIPDNVIKLAAINQAFLKGLIDLQKLNLDDDLFLEAVEDLRCKYYKARS